MSQFSIWLFPAALAAILGLFACIRMGLRWSWAAALQQVLILVCALAGFATIPGGFETMFQSDTAEHKSTEWLATTGWTIAAWVLLIVFNFVQRALMYRVTTDLSFLRVESARRRLQRYQILIWGPPREFWKDMVDLVDCYVKRNTPQAAVIISKWHSYNPPPHIRDILLSYTMLGKVIVHDWEGIIADVRESLSLHRDPKQSGSVGLALQSANRAFAELGRFDDAVRCLEGANIPAARLQNYTVDIMFMSFFSLAGALEPLKVVIARLSAYKPPVPEYSTLFWLGRCHASRGEFKSAIEIFEQAKAKTLPELSVWRDRIDVQVRRCQEKQRIADGSSTVGSTAVGSTAVGGSPAVDTDGERISPADESHETEVYAQATPEQIKRAEAVLSNTRMVNDIIRPQQKMRAVEALKWLLILVYGVTCTFQLLSASTAAQMPDALVSTWRLAWDSGVLDAAAVWHGEWWRLITYQFLHASISHLALNVLALLWFGKLVENMYGTRGFLIIYFVAGTLSGVAQILMNPVEDAVGASGAIMGVFGAAAAGFFRLKSVLPSNIRKSELSWMIGLAVAQTVLDQVVNLFASGHGSMPRIAAYAHLGGLVFGFVLGMLVPLKPSYRRVSPAVPPAMVVTGR